MTVSKETVYITENENEHENHAATQAEEIVEIASENGKYNVTENNDELKWANTIIVATSTVPKDVLIDMKELQPAKSRIQNYFIYGWFTNLLGNNDKRQKDDMQEKKKEVQNAAWVQYSLGHGRGGFGAGSSDGIGYEPGERSTFIILVLSLVTFMLSCTAIFIYFVRSDEYLSETFEYPSIFLIAFSCGGLIACQLCFMCIPVAHTSPCNIILLILVLITMSCVAALVTIRYSTTLLLHAFVITAGVTLFCLLLACTSFDFTSFWLYVLGISVAFSLAVMVMMVSSAITGEYYKKAHMIILCGGVILQTVFLIMELQAIIGGKSIELDEGAYVLGAYMLYTTIINLFLYIVRILANFSDD